VHAKLPRTALSGPRDQDAEDFAVSKLRPLLLQGHTRLMRVDYLLLRHTLSQEMNDHLVAHCPQIFEDEGSQARGQTGRRIERKIPPHDLDFLSPKRWHRDKQ